MKAYERESMLKEEDEFQEAGEALKAIFFEYQG